MEVRDMTISDKAKLVMAEKCEYILTHDKAASAPL